ncbi:flagellar basal body-associated FliL family protein [Enterobacteriaceae bacterium H16N7]|nr:flagellar basal body-associated FliL family protein [Dryocola clanedunensis]
MKKTILICLFSALTAAIVGGGAAAGVMYFMKGSTLAAGHATEEVKEKAKPKKEGDDIFVSLPESVVTLHDSENDDHYMLVELAMVVDNDNSAKKVLAEEPLYQSIIVSTLADMKYETARGLKINDLKKVLSSSMSQGLAAREMQMPYTDVLVKKVVFQ